MRGRVLPRYITREDCYRLQIRVHRTRRMSQALRGNKLPYLCNVCGLSMCGCDLSRHYTNKTNWIALDGLYKCVGDTAVEEELTKVDEHTAYMFRH